MSPNGEEEEPSRFAGTTNPPSNEPNTPASSPSTSRGPETPKPESNTAAANKPKPSPSTPKSHQHWNPSTPPPSPADLKRRALVQKAKARKLNGVRVLEVNAKSAKSVAGYLCMKNTNELHRFIAEIRPITEKWTEARQQGFPAVHVTGKSKEVNAKRFEATTLWKLVTNPSFMTADELASELPLDSDRWPVDGGHMRNYASGIVTMHKIITQHANYFPAPASENHLGGIDGENWFRAYNLLHFVWSEQSAKVTATNPPNDLAVKPDFLTDDDLAGRETDEDRFLSSTITSSVLAVTQYWVGGQRPDDDQAPSISRAHADQRETRFMRELQKSLVKKRDRLATFGQEFHMPFMSEEVMKLLCDTLAAKVTQTWPNRDASQAIPPSVSDVELQEALLADAEANAGVLNGASPERIPFNDMEEFGHIQRILNQVSSPTTTYRQACEILGLDLTSPKVGNVLLKHWQVDAIVWLLGMTKTPLRAGLLADDVGLGKTIAALASLVYLIKATTGTPDAPELSFPATSETKLSSFSIPGPYRPTLIICPPGTLVVWKAELKKFPELRVFYYHSRASKVGVQDESRFIEPVRLELDAFLRKHSNEEDPRTMRIVILASYASFHLRSTHWESEAERKRKREASPERDTDGPEDGPDEENDGNEEPELEESEAAKLRSHFENRFGVVICDESHKLKSVLTRTHLSIKLLKARCL